MATPPHEDRRREVLHAALLLFSEQGYAGASLRELARRLAIAQPSLYHYATSKEDLLRQVVEYIGGEILYGDIPPERPSTLDEVPAFLRGLVLGLYEKPLYPVFLRFLFANSPAVPAVEAAARRLYSDTFVMGVRVLFAQLIESGELSEEEALSLARMVVCAIGLPLIETRVVYGEPTTQPWLVAYADFVVEFTRGGLRAWRSARAAG